MSFEFQSTLFRTLSEMLDAIAETWLGDDEDFKRESLANNTPLELAYECVEGFGLNVPDWENPSHMEKHDYTVEDLEAAFKRLAV